MRYILVHSLPDERPIYIASEHVIAVESHTDKDGPYSRICCTNGTTYDAVEDAITILQQLQFKAKD